MEFKLNIFLLHSPLHPWTEWIFRLEENAIWKVVFQWIYNYIFGHDFMKWKISSSFYVPNKFPNVAENVEQLLVCITKDSISGRVMSRIIIILMLSMKITAKFESVVKVLFSTRVATGRKQYIKFSECWGSFLCKW